MLARRVLALLVLGLLCTVAVRAADSDTEEEAEDEDYEEETVDRGFLLVWKKLIEKDIIQGKTFTVQVSLHNAGSRYSNLILSLQRSGPNIR